MTVADDSARQQPPRPTGRREQHRIDRTRQFLGTALDIVTTEGFDALTMQRLADQCDSAIGAVYRFEPRATRASKGWASDPDRWPAWC